MRTSNWEFQLQCLCSHHQYLTNSKPFREHIGVEKLLTCLRMDYWDCLFFLLQFLSVECLV
uniref:Uncharacterized protein n=1 Tax=Rhizophora mucronata TaxID=61149 RepID=A0A2P2LQ48_RHIMU